MSQGLPPNAVRRTYVEPSEAAPPARPAPAATSQPSSAPAPAAAAPRVPDSGDTEPFRPIHRPPMAVLHVFDDGQKTAELVRVRAAKFVIGRTAGDLVIPQDPLLSGRHAEVVRESQEGRWCWCLHDLGSTNGSFVRAKVGVLKDGTEFLLARCRFRFVAAPEPADGSAPEESAPAPGAIYKTIGWQHMPQAPTGRGRPCLVELLPTGEGRRLPLSSDSQWIGRDPRRCALVLPDPTISPCHAKIFRDSQDRWHIEDANALNGLWIRIHERIPLTSQSSFLLGEQIFAVVLP